MPAVSDRFSPSIERQPLLDDVLAENALLRQEIRTARKAAEITAGLVVQQFEKSEALLTRVQQANAALAENEGILAQRTDLLNATLESISQGITVVDKNLNLMLCNRRVLEMCGYPPELGAPGTSLAAINAFRVARGDFSENESQLRLERLRNRFRNSRQAVSRRADLGNGRVLDIDYQPIGDGWVATFSDVSAYIHIQKEIESARAAAVAANAAKSDFLANMSHEIRTPMNAIIGMTHLALQTGLDAKQRNYLEKVDAAAKGLLGVINDILDFSKIEAGKVSFERIDFHLDDVMDGVADLAAIKAQDKGLELLFDIDTDVPVALVGDPLRLGQVLTNLVGNAIKFTEQGEVTIAISRAAAEADGVRLRFAVTDTGVGLSEEQRSRLFNAFSQADSSTTRKYGGTGLGLTISKRLVELMDGEIGIDSQPGVGSTFFFTARFGLHAEQRPLQETASHMPGLRILVVDDNASARDIFLAILGSLRFKATAVAGGSEALAELERAQGDGEPYGLVLMDWHMPQMDGVETIRRIRADTTLVATPMCMMVTAYSREELLQQVEQAQIRIEGLLVKPVSPSTLCDSIMTVFGHEVGRRLRKQQREVNQRGAAKPLRGARILLVEDNDINRELALEILSTAGMHVDVAGDGAQALEKIAHTDYDGVLMDCQMPVMDGYEATRRIRADARYATLPVIAMTANAMAGDREKCLACGMNDHIAKPIDVGQLFLTLAHWVKPSTPASEIDEKAETSAAVEVPQVVGLDTAAALSRLGGDGGLLRKLIERFREGQADFVAEIRAACDMGEHDTAVRLTHTLKGLAGNIGATKLFKAAERLERALQDEPDNLPEDLLVEVAVRLADQIAQIDCALPRDCAASPPPACRQVDLTVLTPLLRELALLLVNNNAAATAHIEPLAVLFKGSAQADDFRRVAKMTESFAFDKALKLLRDIAASMNVRLD